MIREATIKLIDRTDLSCEEAGAVMDEIMSGQSTQVQTAAYLAALSVKGETIEEVTGSALQMRSHALPLEHGQSDVFEIVGTGGDKAGSFNISTTASIVIASAGVKVAKHGNRAASSRSGAADCLEALGVNIDLPPEQSAELLEEIGICFLFAQKYHTSMKFVAPVRRELGIRTIFNILGPLTNPARATRQLLGVYSAALVEPLARVLSKLGVKRGMVVYGQDRLDEISVSAPTTVCSFEDSTFFSYEIKPEDFGMRSCDKSELVGGEPAENAEITRRILDGERGAKRDAVLLNAGAGLYIAGIADSIADGVSLAASLIDSGKAKEKLEQFISQSQRRMT
ncbi:MAG: anthranilate phosphoribosyltransferase [Eubacteriales bacterium]